MLDHFHHPLTTEDKELFQVKQEFMHSVFEHCSLTSVGKSLVHAREDDSDVQMSHKEHMMHLKSSTKATIKMADLLKCLIRTKLDDDTWRGTAKEFASHWLDKM